MARFMALSQDNRVAQLVSRMLENKLLAWPAGRPAPEPLRDESFLLPAACLVQARAPAAPRSPLFEPARHVRQTGVRGC